MSDLEEVKLPEALSDLLFDKAITPKQRKFILLFVHSEGLKTATQCAIEAGYAAGSAKTRASELQNPERYPLVAKAIDSMSREEVEKKLQDLKEQYSIETTFEEVKELENKS